MFYKQLCATRRARRPLSKHSERPPSTPLRRCAATPRWGKSRAVFPATSHWEIASAPRFLGAEKHGREGGREETRPFGRALSCLAG